VIRPHVLVLASDVLFPHFFSAESQKKLTEVTDWKRSSDIEDSAILREQIANADVLMTTWHTPFGLSIGGGARYVDSVIRPVSTNGVPPPPNQTNMRTAPDYWVVDLMASYAINDNLSVQLNAYNLTDELYVATLNNSGARYMPGSPRSALLTVSFSF